MPKFRQCFKISAKVCWYFRIRADFLPENRKNSGKAGQRVCIYY